MLMPLVTSRLLLRPWQPTDGQALLALIDAERPRILADFPNTTAAVQDLSSADEFISRKRQEWEQHQAFQLSIWLRETEQLLGFISFKPVDWSVPKSELAYLVAAGYEGRGLMTEAGLATLQWGFEELGLARVFCYIKPQNARSLALAKRLGFQTEGLLRGNFRSGTGQLTDSVVCGLLNPATVLPPAGTAPF
ncbi:GNAT family N-acetyltransferase [Hymenobacter sp. BT730]|uniref:GNAT family N-acetyltransferase n=1 Tax=Hymenobacter sp. BT730 TaxID=3063332 RepID=UPI0026DEC834|nr:GNAT family N-acetyltransferase [Hymenobacter sp. BT730]